EQRKIVCKPLDGMGGRSVFVLGEDDLNARVVFETLTDYGQRFAIAQRYIPDIVESGDARVLLIDGEPVPYALARIPSAHDHRGNLAAAARPRAPPQPPAAEATWHAARSCCGRARPRSGTGCSPCCSWPACCTDSSSSGSPSAPARATGAALRDWKCCWCRTSFRRLTRT